MLVDMCSAGMLHHAVLAGGTQPVAGRLSTSSNEADWKFKL